MPVKQYKIFHLHLRGDNIDTPAEETELMNLLREGWEIVSSSWGGEGKIIYILRYGLKGEPTPDKPAPEKPVSEKPVPET